MELRNTLSGNAGKSAERPSACILSNAHADTLPWELRTVEFTGRAALYNPFYRAGFLSVTLTLRDCDSLRGTS